MSIRRAGSSTPASPPLPPPVSELGRRSSFRGEVTGGGDLRISGSLDGTVRIRGRVEVPAGGHLGREVSARDLSVAGEAEGWFELTGSIHARRGSRLRGTAVAGRWRIDDGARLDLEMRTTAGAPRN